MSSTFFGLELGYTGLQANQTAMQVVSNNIANINTPGYARETANLNESDPYTVPNMATTGAGQLGTGVTVASISQTRNLYLDQSLQQAGSTQGMYTTMQSTLTQIQTAFGSPTTGGIGQQIQALFNSFSDLSANPESSAIRATVLNQAQSVVSSFSTTGQSLSQVSTQIGSQITGMIGKINNISTQIAALNKEIGAATAVGQQANDLIDQRSQLMGQLSGMVNVQTNYETNPQTGQQNGMVDVIVGGLPAVQGISSNTLPSAYTSLNGNAALVQSNGQLLPINSGSITGLIKTSSMLQGYQTQLNTLAYNLNTSVNNLHTAGYGLDNSTGNDFFVPIPPPGTNAASALQVNQTIVNNPDKIAAASPPTPPNPVAPGNGAVALQISQLNTIPVIGSDTLTGYYSGLITQVGADTNAVTGQATNQQYLVTQLQNQQQSLSGVNLDEELTKMLQYQNAYSASAKVVSTADTFVTTVINEIGAKAATG